MNNFEKETDTAIYFLRGPFSNFYSAAFILDNYTYSNSEQAFMHLKALHFNDLDHANLILNTSNPAQAKAYGRGVKNFDVIEWHSVSYDYMYRVNKAKYEQNYKLKQLLLSTKGKELVECNPKDYIWSCGYIATDTRALNKSEWKGKNWLGRVLMDVRSSLKNKE